MLLFKYNSLLQKFNSLKLKKIKFELNLLFNLNFSENYINSST